jgi:prepilin-type N-terminal cleavage/methylation domain-containing protein
LNKKNGISLVELIIVLVVVAIFAAMAVPNYSKMRERSKSYYAETSLISIYNMEKRYKLDNGEYFVCTVNPCLPEEIKDNLGLDIGDKYFTYSIKENNDGGIPGFSAVALRLGSGVCSGNTITIYHNDSKPVKSCAIWD